MVVENRLRGTTVLARLRLTGTALYDKNNNEIVELTAIGSAVNALEFVNAATGNGPILRAKGGDTNIDLNLTPKGSGVLKANADIQLADDDGLVDSNGNEVLDVVKVASAVNFFQVKNAATGNGPELVAAGSDTDVSHVTDVKGAGVHIVKSSMVYMKRTASVLTDASNQTLTDAHILGGLLLRDPNGSARTDTTPTAAEIVAAVKNAEVGTSFLFVIKNTADGAETITLAGGTTVTITGTATIAQDNTKIFLVVITNVTGASEAVTFFSLGTLVH